MVHPEQREVKAVFGSALHVVVAPALVGGHHAVASEAAQDGFDGVPADAREL